MTLIAHNVTMQIAGKFLIENIGLTLTPGEILAVVGPNGAGKSTLLRILAGELKPTQGTVSIGSQTLSSWRKRDLARMRAVLPQSSTLAFGFLAYEVVLMGRTPHLKGGESHEDHMIVNDAMRMTRTEHLANQVYTTLSGGERQRIQLARVLAQIWQGTTPRYLLLDEPTNNLDLSHQHGTLTIARQFTERGIGVITVLHDLNLAAQYADRILILKGGQALAKGTPNKILTPEIIQQTFDLPVMVQPHPCYNCPLIIPMPHFVAAPFMNEEKIS